jgi:hypothetical protein
MDGEADQILHTADEPIVNESKIVDKTIPNLSDYWKKSRIIKPITPSAG